MFHLQSLESAGPGFLRGSKYQLFPLKSVIHVNLYYFEEIKGRSLNIQGADF